ncbi:unnamed protein product [Prorocentrum cordatum]|uniref:Uncharacterized protein n=1 Tax=Prorocentrum cordatum TaxID=2364126 RepID=A0ABN9T352_9DINO|nr:unnamed protein product [Polarella glacialis]
MKPSLASRRAVAETVTTRGGAASPKERDVSAAIMACRRVIRDDGALGSAAEEVELASVAAEPLARWLTLKVSLEVDNFGDMLWETYQGAVKGTGCAEKLKMLPDDLEAWNDMAQSLRSQKIASWACVVTVAAFAVVLGSETGRNRFLGYLTLSGCTLAMVWGGWRRPRAAEDQATARGDSSEGDCMAKPPKQEVTTESQESQTLAELHAENERLRAGVPSAAFRAFAEDRAPDGPLSRTAAGAAADSAGVYAPVAPGCHAKTKAQAARVQEAPMAAMAAMAQQSTNPYWAWSFWQWVAEANETEPFEQEIMRLLMSNGHVGPATRSPPRESLKSELELAALHAKPTHGAGALDGDGVYSRDDCGLTQDQELARWNASLPPDRTRAALEIYRSMRSAGAASVRDWLAQGYTGNKSAQLRIDLWNAATSIDFTTARVKSQVELLNLLAGDDGLEMNLRRIASSVYDKRTGDKSGAQKMLAIPPPGAGVDLAPTWLVTEATAHSKMEHQRAERDVELDAAALVVLGGERDEEVRVGDMVEQPTEVEALEQPKVEHGEAVAGEARKGAAAPRADDTPGARGAPELWVPVGHRAQARSLDAEFFQNLPVSAGMVALINGVDAGHLRTASTSRAAGISTTTRAAWRSVHAFALKETASLERDCRGLGLTGGPPDGHVREVAGPESYTRSPGALRVAPKPMHLLDIDEPKDDSIVDTLSALPEHERRFYEHEASMFSYVGQADAVICELEDQHAVVNGTEEGYATYLCREDLPKGMWSFVPASEAMAFGGFSTVPKKAPSKQREVLMNAPANYMWMDPTERADHGLAGGEAPAQWVVPADHWEIAAFDENNAFTRIRARPWYARWQATPSLKAWRGWHLLTPEVQQEVTEQGWVAPLHHRLAIGGSHSVHILMSTNLTTIGRALSGAGARLAQESDADEPCIPDECDQREEDDFPDLDVDDETRVKQNHVAKSKGAGQSSYTVAGQTRAACAARRRTTRVFVVMHLFAGERRSDDAQAQLEPRCEEADLELLFLSADLATNAAWDLAEPDRANVLAVNLMAMCEAVVVSGGRHLVEHPEDNRGKFNTSHLQTYPRELCDKIASITFDAPPRRFHAENARPTSGQVPEGARPRVSAWGERCSLRRAVAIRNEDAARGRGLVLRQRRLGLYLHVDDGVCIGPGEHPGAANRLMEQLADELELTKVVGYEVIKRPVSLRLPNQKRVAIAQELERPSRAEWVHTDDARSIVGSWVWGALLRRDLLSIPSAVFKFLDLFPER